MNGSLEHIQCDESDGSVQHRTTSKRKDVTKNIDNNDQRDSEPIFSDLRCKSASEEQIIS